MKKSFYITAILAFILAAPSLATEVYSWQQCIDLAIKNNNSLKSAMAGERSSHYQRNASTSGFLPQVSGTLTSNRGNNGNSTNPSLTTVQGSINQAYTGSLSVTQNIFAGFQDVGKFDQAKANYLVSQINVAIVKAQLSYDLVSSFQNFIYAKDTVKLLDSIISRREENLRIIELRYKSGMENKGSLLLAQAYLEQAKYDRLQGSNLIESSRAQLCKAMGLSECKDFDVSGEVPIVDEKNNAIDYSAIIETTPQHLQVKAQEEAAKAGITIAKSAFFPTFNITGTKGNRGASLFPQNDYWSVGMNVSWNFFSGGKDYNTTNSAYSALQVAKENRESTDKQILVNLRQAHNSYVEAISKLKVDESFRDALKLRADIARSKYNNGLLIFENWDQIETDLITRQKSYLQSKLSRVLTEAAWQQVQGNGVFYGQ